MNTVEKMFYDMIRDACELRKKDPDADGRAFWQPRKNLLAKTDNLTFDWQPMSRELVEKFIHLDESVELNHFLIQQVRIPTTEKACLRKLIQIALNIGQYIANGDMHKYDVSLMCIHMYISSADADRISRELKKVKV